MDRLLAQATPQAVAALAQHYLQQAQAAATRMSLAAEGEALHDARVALRRLYTLMRTYQRECGEQLTGKLCRRLRRLARRSNRARDREVQYAWLSAQGKGLRRNERPGHAWLLAQWRPQDGAELQRVLAAGIEELQRKLAAPLQRLATGRGPLLAQATARHSARLGERLLQELAAIAGADDLESAHAARIKVKRLRYLLMPLRQELEPSGAICATLQQLQDVLGELHDRQLLAQHLPKNARQLAAERAAQVYAAADTAAAAVPASAWRAAELPGLLAIAARNRSALEQCYSRLQQDYLSRLPALEAQLHQVVVQLEASAAH